MDTDDKIRIGYQTSIQLIAYQGQIIWQAFGALVSVNTGLTAIAGAALAWFPNLAIGIGLKPNTHDTSRKVIILRVGCDSVTNRVPP